MVTHDLKHTTRQAVLAKLGVTSDMRAISALFGHVQARGCDLIRARMTAEQFEMVVVHGMGLIRKLYHRKNISPTTQGGARPQTKKIPSMAANAIQKQSDVF